MMSQTPGLPLKPPDWAVPPEWQPAPEYTPQEKAAFDVTLREMTQTVTDAELAHWVTKEGGDLYVGDDGLLRCRNGGSVPLHLREEVKRRQEALAALIAEAPQAAVAVTTRQLDFALDSAEKPKG